jgi:hypothetical protein
MKREQDKKVGFDELGEPFFFLERDTTKLKMINASQIRTIELFFNTM